MASKSTKKALILSVLSMVLCVTMLMGTTFAWFTDSVSSANNVIVSGNLDIELYHEVNGKDVAVDGATKLFDDVTLWEPGAAVYENLTVKNLGTLALKYRLSLNVTDENTVEGTDLKLSDVLKIAVVKGGVSGDREAILSAAETAGWESLASFTESGELPETNDEDTYGVVVYWEPTANDNDYNLANGKKTSDGAEALHVTLGVSLFATQLGYEEDAFGSSYDSEATFGAFVEVGTTDEFFAALKNAKAGQPISIKLTGDIEWPTEGHHGENDITPAHSIEIFGDGHTITATGAGVTPLGDKEASMTLYNVTVKDTSVSYDEQAWELSYLELGGTTLECVDVKFLDPVIVDSGKAVFTDCSFVGHNDSNSNEKQYGAWVENGDAYFNGCTFEGTRGLKICDKYASEVGTVVIDGCRFVALSEKPGVAIDDCDTQDMDITIKNSIFIQCQPGDQGNYIYETDNTVPTLENNEVPENVANNASSLSSAISAASAGDTVYLYGDVDNGTQQLLVDKDITIDLNGCTFTTNVARPVSLKNGASVKNGTINATCTVAAIVITGEIGTIEDLEINITTPAGKTTTGIQVYGNDKVEAIRNVTITGVTQGIEVAHCSPSTNAEPAVGIIENVTIEATKVGIYSDSWIGLIKNCNISGGEVGINTQLRGVYKVSMELQNCVVNGGLAGIWAHDEKGVSNTNNCSFSLTYDADTVIGKGTNGSLVWEFEDECLGVVTLNKPV